MNMSVLGNYGETSKDKHLLISMSLLMRLFEWCHEDAKDDVAMHRVMEKLVAFNDGVNPLTIDVYDCLIADAQEKEAEEVEPAEDEVEYVDSEDIMNAYNDGCEMPCEDCCNNEENEEVCNYTKFEPMEITLSADDECYNDCQDEEEYDDEEDIPVSSLDEIEKIIMISRN